MSARSTPASAFFEQLGRRGHEPLLRRARGTIRFDLVDDGHSHRWIVDVDRGDVAVSHRNTAGDCRLRLTSDLFQDMVSGAENPMAAVLRGAIEVEGDWTLLVLAQRLFRQPAADRPVP
jgi:putative sterol carrier protein